MEPLLTRPERVVVDEAAALPARFSASLLPSILHSPYPYSFPFFFLSVHPPATERRAGEEKKGRGIDRTAVVLLMLLAERKQRSRRRRRRRPEAGALAEGGR